MKLKALLLVFLLVTAANSAVASSSIANESQNNKSISLSISTPLRVQLHSTYWTLDNASSPQMSISQPVITPIMPGPKAPAGCDHPGSGCGNILWKINFKKVGKYLISATRTSCGEAMRCVGSAGRFKVQVVVSR